VTFERPLGTTTCASPLWKGVVNCMMDFVTGAPPRQLASIAGALYLINIVGGAFAIGFVRAALFTPDLATTAHNIQTHQLLYRSGLAAHLVVTVTNVPLALIFYELFKVVNRRLALLTAFFILVATAIEAAGLVHEFAPLALLGSGPFASALPPAQLEALASLPGALSDGSYHVYTVFFGLDILCLAYLVLQSRFVPRAIGVLLAIDGVAYLVYSFADLLVLGSPPIWSPGSSCPRPSLRGLSACGSSYSRSTPRGGRRGPARQPTRPRAASRAFAGADDVPAGRVAGWSRPRGP
jgi:hypothetical protein